MLFGCRPRRVGGVVAIALPLALLACERHDVEVELPTSGRRLSRTEHEELQRIADAAFRDARSHLDGLPPRITLIVRWGKDVIPETGESGAAAYPMNIGWTVDGDRDVLAIIRTQPAGQARRASGPSA
jgi:hypothetical protein